MTIYIENPKDCTKANQSKNSVKLQDTKISTQKSVAFIKKTVPFTVAFQRIKYVRINLTKGVKDVYTENLIKH